MNGCWLDRLKRNMKSLFAQYGSASPITLKLYTNGTEDVSWVKGIDTVTGVDLGSSGGSYVEGASYLIIAIFNEPISLGVTTNIAGVTDSTVDITGYKRVYVDWEVVTESSAHYLIVDDTKNGDYNNFEARAEFGAGTGRKVTSLAINALTGSKYIRINAFNTTTAPNVESSEIRIHRVWLEK